MGCKAASQIKAGLHCGRACCALTFAETPRSKRRRVEAIMWRRAMAWTTPTLVEICIGLEINGYLPAEF